MYASDKIFGYDIINNQWINFTAKLPVPMQQFESVITVMYEICGCH